MIDDKLFELAKYGRLSDMLEQVNKIAEIDGLSIDEAVDEILNMHKAQENKYNEEDFIN